MTTGRTPRVLVDATSVPADRGGVGRYVDGLLGALGRRDEVDLAVVCQRNGQRALRAAAPEAQVVAGAGRGQPPPGPARLGADRSAAAGPAGRRQGAALAVLHVPAAGRLPGDGDRARRDLLHRAGALRQVTPHLLPVGDQDVAAPGRAGDRAEQGHPRRADPPARRRPDPHRRRLPRGRPGRVPRARADEEKARVRARLGLGDADLRRVPRRQGAPQERAQPDPRLGGRRRRPAATARRWCSPAARATTTRSTRRWRACRRTCGCCAPAICASPICPASSAARWWRPTRPTARASACRCSRRWPAAPRCSPRPRLSLPEVGGDAVAYTGPDADAIARDLAALLDDEPRRLTLAAAGLSRAKEFTWDSQRRGAPGSLGPRRGLTPLAHRS